MGTLASYLLPPPPFRHSEGGWLVCCHIAEKICLSHRCHIAENHRCHIAENFRLPCHIAKKMGAELWSNKNILCSRIWGRCVQKNKTSRTKSKKYYYFKALHCKWAKNIVDMWLWFQNGVWPLSLFIMQIEGGMDTHPKMKLGGKTRSSGACSLNLTPWFQNGVCDPPSLFIMQIEGEGAHTPKWNKVAKPDHLDCSLNLTPWFLNGVWHPPLSRLPEPALQSPTMI